MLTHCKKSPYRWSILVWLTHSRDPDRVARRYAGAGQGLAIPEQLVEVMGGNIGVSSAPGICSTFWSIIPCRKARMRSDVYAHFVRERLYYHTGRRK